MSDCIYARHEGVNYRISFSELQYVESKSRYVRLVTEKKAFLVENSLYKVEQLLPSDQFCRIHKSYIISLRHVHQFAANFVTIAKRELPIGRYYKNNLASRILIVNNRVKLTRKEINDILKPPAEE